MKRDYSLEIIEIAATVVLALLSLVIPAISLEGTFIVASLGISIALGTFLLKREITTQIDEKFELYGLLNKIKDDDLRRLGYLVVSEAQERMRKLGKGIMELGTDEVYSTAIAKMRATKKGEIVLAIHTSQEGIEYLYAWKDVIPLNNYFLENKKAIQRGVKIERVFVTRKSNVIDPQNGIVDGKALRILKEHQAAGVDVTVAWMEDVLDTSLVEDYIIFVNSVVETHQMALDGRYHQVTLRRDKQEINLYIDRFKKLKNHGRPLEQVLEELQAAS